MADARIMPAEVALLVDDYIDDELRDATKYDNRTPLDVNGVWSLHRLAAEIYAAGWAAGEATEAQRNRRARGRERTDNG